MIGSQRDGQRSVGPHTCGESASATQSLAGPCFRPGQTPLKRTSENGDEGRTQSPANISAGCSGIVRGGQGRSDEEALRAGAILYWLVVVVAWALGILCVTGVL